MAKCSNPDKATRHLMVIALECKDPDGNTIQVMHL